MVKQAEYKLTGAWTKITRLGYNQTFSREKVEIFKTQRLEVEDR